jgi:CRP/FNR family transcriptional regulator
MAEMRCDRTGDFGCAGCGTGPLPDWTAAEAGASGALDAIRRRRRVPAGAPVFRQGEACDALYCVAEGVVGLRVIDDEGACAMVGVASRGDLLGARAFLRGQPHGTAAEALTDVTLCRIARPDAEALAAARPQFGRRLVAACLDALDRAERALVENAALSNRDRLLALLVRLAERCGRREPDGALAARLPVSREDLAGMIGVRPETLSRLMTRLREEGAITVSGRRLTIPAGRALRPAAAEAPEK